MPAPWKDAARPYIARLQIGAHFSLDDVVRYAAGTYDAKQLRSAIDSAIVREELIVRTIHSDQRWELQELREHRRRGQESYRDERIRREGEQKAQREQLTAYYELVKPLKDGALLIEGEDGQLYRAVRVEL